MRASLVLALLMVGAAGLSAAHKVVRPTATASNDQLEITATITLDQGEIARKLGADPGNGIALVEIRAVPRTDQPLRVLPDDFILLAHNDGERSRPFEPSQLAGHGALVVRTNQDGGATIGRTPGRTYGGVGGTRPQTLPGRGVAGGGTSGGEQVHTTSDAGRAGDETLLAALKSKELPAKDTVDPIDGFLYFPLTGKHKLKDMAVLYRGPAGKLDLEFEH